jgi:very-short-patch-repair endonuclease
MEISIEGVVNKKLGLVSHQNAVPLLRQLTISSREPGDLRDLRLTLEPSLPFASSKVWHIDSLSASGVIQLPDRDLELKQGYLAGLSESQIAAVDLRLTSGPEVLAKQRYPVELLATNQWGGANAMPELLAAFCMPNDPAVDKVLKSASNVLRRAGRPDGIDGYESKSRRRSWELASAIWSAVCGCQVSYAVPPASFETEGQKIRTPAQILEGGIATCLDTALLFAAAVEQAGLNPILVLTEGHAFSGVWLQPQEFAQVLNDDASAVRKRIDLHELVVFETTLATHSPAPGFQHAIDVAVRQLTDENLLLALDIRRARLQKLRPLAIIVDRSVQRTEQIADIREGLEAAPELPGFDVETIEVPDTPSGKLELWQRKLLDLTTRNRLLHLPDGAKAVRLVCPDPGGLEDLLADKKSVRIVPMPPLDVGGRDSQIYEERNQENLEEETARQCLVRAEVPSRMEKAQLDAALVELYRKAKLDLEEGGSNTLFLAIGFLRWKKTEDDPKFYSAPLILIPVKLERRSVLSGVKMSIGDDEPRFNLTLLELLRHDFELNIRGLGGELPTDESGVDVEAVWNTVRHAVRDMPGFEVTTDVVLGTFSFAKYLMWRDLIDRTEQLMQNDVVRRLLGQADHSLVQADPVFPDSNKLDQEVRPDQLFTPLPGDSSQLAAVVASAQGHNFVLDGPPGTGKSQTIANMIAHNLALGRRVLFVAEKMAALDVVKRRLDEKGIGQFCLELHSNKSSKVHVLQQLDRVWSSRGHLTPEEWQGHAEKVRSLRDRINRVVAVLHKRWPNGWTIYGAVGLVVRDANPFTPRLSWSAETEHNNEQIVQLRELARKLELNRAVTEGIGVRMALLSQTEWSNFWQESIITAARRVVTTSGACESACVTVIQLTRLRIDPTKANVASVLQLVKLFANAYAIDLRFAFSPTAKAIHGSIQEALSLLDEYEALESGLSQAYTRECIRRMEVERLQGDWAAASGRFWPLSALAKRRIARSLVGAQFAPGPPDLDRDLPRLNTMKALVARIDGLDRDLQGVPGWAALATDKSRLRLAAEVAEGIRAALMHLADSPEQLVGLRRESQRLVVDTNELLEPDGRIGQAISQFEAAYRALSEAAKDFAAVAGSEIDLQTQARDLSIAARTIIDNQVRLHAWCSWQRVRQESLSRGLQPLVEAIEQGSVPNLSAAEIFEVAYARWFAAKCIDAEPLLRNFVPAEHQSDIQAYSNAVDELSELTVKYINSRLSGAIPDRNAVTRHSGFGILKHELQKSRRHKPVRELSREMGEAFTALTPCVLMSPLSIAQYLPPDHQLFDLVIFDEASQIAPWDAVGSIARGKQVVVAGDPRQMPPTSFFNRGTSAGEDDTDEDLESILEECIGTGLRQHSLTWHYRSRHESLITFSNYHYYGGSLVTFPAADTRPSAVTWRKVDGVYSRGKGRYNQMEAKAIVDEVVRRLTSSAFIASRWSIGIITLNAEQQQVVDDLLDRARQEHPSIDPYFREGLTEPVIVKNLETMQGDERDLIILGIGFGPTEPGANIMSMNFGPLNREGGWRRLNVALTRARQEMLIFTSFEPSMIDLNRTSARAVQDLRHFIEFAQQGPKAMAAAVCGPQGEHESPFEQYVADGLRAKGWETRPQIGVSRFRIDLGVVHPDRPGDYLAGIECDGATYHSAATARDRDKIRGEILRGLGWRLLRVWSTEWWVDREGALERLHQSIRAVLEESRAALKLQRGDRPVSGSSTADSDSHREGALGGPIDNGDDRLAALPILAPAAESEPQALSRHARGAAQPSGLPTRRTYRSADVAFLKSSLRPDLFQDASYDATLEDLIRRVLEQEAPMLDSLLVDRVARLHGFKRSGRLIRERVLEIAERHYHFEKDAQLDRGDFVWLSPDDAQRWNCYRVPAGDDDVRYIEEIALAELAAAARAERGSDVPGQVAKVFRIKRLSNGARIRIAIAAGIDATSPP